MVYKLGSRLRAARSIQPKIAVMLITVLSIGIFSSFASAQEWFAPKVNVWWPTQNARVAGVQPIKADVPGLDVSSYHMYWSVDAGHRNYMPTNMEHYPHKESLIDVSSWTWRGEGPYQLSYTVLDMAGVEVTRTTVDIYVKHPTMPKTTQTTSDTTTQTTQPAPITAPAPAPTTITTEAAVSTALTTQAKPAPNTAASTTLPLFVHPDNNSLRQAAEWKSSRPADAAIMERMGSHSQAKWFGDWNSNVESDVRAFSQAAQQQNSLPVLVAYNIPQRDCGSYSAGGSSGADSYRTWIRSFAQGLGSRPAIVIVEPDALAGMDCLNSQDRATRLQLLSDSVQILKKQSGVKVYLDGGNPRWHSAAETARRLNGANVRQSDGFSLNVSNFFTTAENEKYGTDVSGRLSGKHFVVDTSRNGNGPTADQEWCNPSGRALGDLPTTSTGKPAVDAYLWIKAPGESDGSCNGAPAAGAWMPEYALGLAKAANL